MNLEKYFECNEIKLKDQQISKRLQANIILKINSKKYGTTYLIYDAKHNRKFFVNAQLKCYLN